MQLQTAVSLIQSFKTCLDEVYAGRYSADNVMREIQNRALDLRQSGLSDVEKENIRNELQQLEIKKELLAWYATDSVSPAYKLLADWFQSASCTIEDKQLLAVCSLYESFKTQFSAQTKPVNFIALGALDFDEPVRFCAFLLWILESGDHLRAIADSAILHHFFANQFIFLSDEDNPVHVVYRLLNQLKETSSVGQLLDYANAVHSGVMGTPVNRPVAAIDSKEATFKSSNLTGGDFEHPHKPPTSGLSLKRLWITTLTDNSDDIVKLYQWFGIEMLKSLDVNQPAHHKAFKLILASAAGDALRRELPALILRGEIPVVQLILWFKAIADEAREMKGGISALISTDPFFLHILSGDSTAINQLSLEQLEQSILALQRSVAEGAVNSTSVILWVNLYKSLKGSNRCSLEQISTMNEFILNQAARFENRLTDEVLSAFKTVDISKQQVQNRLDLFKQELITSFTSDSFEPLQRKWGEIRARVYNLLDLCPQLRNSSHYPVDTYALKAFYIEQVWHYAPEKFNLMATLMTMHASDEDTDNTNKRTVLEALLFTQELALQEIFIQYLDSKAIAWANEIFGDSKNLLEKSILHDNTALVMRILSLNGDDKPNQAAVSEALFLAASAGKLDIATHLLNLAGDNKPDRAAVSAALEAAARNGEWDIVIHLLNLAGDNKPNQAAVSTALKAAASAGKLDIVTQLLNLAGDNKPNQAAVSAALEGAVMYGEWDIVIHLLNLSGDNKPGRAAVSAALEAAARYGRLNIVIHLLNLAGDNKPNQAAVSTALEAAARTGKLDIVTYLLNLVGDNKPGQAAVSAALEAAARVGKLDIVTYLLNLVGDNKPGQAAVSRALEVAASVGELNIVTQLLNLAGDNKPGRAAVSRALEAAAMYGRLNIVIHLLNLAGDNKPNQAAVSGVLSLIY